MAEETVSPQEAAESKVNDILFGSAAENLEPEETEEIEPEEQASEEIEETEETTEVEEKPEEIALHEVQIGDNLYEVPEEIKAELEKAQDYTQKTQGVSAERKQVELKQAELNQQSEDFKFMESVQDDIDQAQIIKWQIDSYRDHIRKNIDGLSSTEIEKIRFQIDELEQHGKSIKDSVTLKHQEHQQAMQQARKELREKSTEVLRSKIPSWNDAVQTEVKAFGQSVGFTEQELDNALDPREWEVLWKASQYDRLQQGKSTALKKVSGAPAIKPKARREVSDGTKRKISTRKRLNTATDNKAKAKIIQDDIAKRLGL
jgi:hypothetical protein